MELMPLHGYWRLNPEDHYDPKFEPCMYPDACLGVGHARNANVSSTRNISNSALSNTCEERVFEGPPIAGGYKNDCNGERCRLCATCAVNFRRSNSILGKCDQCPDPGTNRALLALGVLVAVSAASVLVYVTMSEEDSKDNISDALQKIIVRVCCLVVFLCFFLSFCFLIFSPPFFSRC